MTRTTRDTSLPVIAALVLGSATLHAAPQSSPAARWPQDLVRDRAHEVRSSWRRAQDDGHALLVLALPDAADARSARLAEWRAFLAGASDLALADLAVCEVIASPLDLLGELRDLPVEPFPADTLAVLVELPHGTRVPLVSRVAEDPLDLRRAEELLARPGVSPSTLRDLRWEAALRDAIAPDLATVERRARAERRIWSPDEMHRFEAARITGARPDADLVRRFPARARRVAAEPGERGVLWSAALAATLRRREQPAARCGLEAMVSKAALGVPTRLRCSSGGSR